MKPIKRKKVSKGGFDVEVDGKTYIVEGKLVEKKGKDGTVKVRKFKAKGSKDTPIGKIKDVTRYRKDK